MLLPQLRPWLVAIVLWPHSATCCAASSKATQPTSSTAALPEKSFRERRRLGRVTDRDSRDPPQTALSSERALRVRGGGAREDLPGERHRRRGVNRKPLPIPEALSR